MRLTPVMPPPITSTSAEEGRTPGWRSLGGFQNGVLKVESILGSQ